MLLSNEFRSARPADELFTLLSDVERIAPCLPGATLEGPHEDGWIGRMSVRIGPIKASYRGTVRRLELDEGDRRSVMVASADEENGGGDAEARITTWVEGLPEGSLVRVETDLQLRGRLAQFGRGAIDKVAQRMMDVFAANLEQAADVLVAPGGGQIPEPEPATGRRPAPAAARTDDALDLGTLGFGVPRWALPAAAGALIGFGYGYLAGRLAERRR
jgi:carbon monoxide dehydrogenase subunit G